MALDNVTIENFNKIMKKKVNILLDLSIYNQLNLQNTINNIYYKYILLIGNTLREYSINYENKEKILEISEKFYKILENNNILNLLDIIYKNIK